MPTYSRERETEAAHALTHNQEVWSGQGWAVVTAGGLTAGSNALQLDVGSYEVLTGGTSTVSVGPTTIDAQLPDSDPYWLVVYVDGSGALQTTAGPEGAVAPGLGVDVREISSPPPPTLAAVGPVTVLGRVLVTDDGIADARIDDRVFGGDRVFDTIDARTVEAETLNSLTDAGIISSNNSADITLIEDSFVTVSGQTTQTVYDSSVIDVISGSISGFAANPVVITFADSSTVTVTNARTAGQDSDNQSFTQATTLPPLSNVTKIELTNDTNTERDYGWSILTL